MLFAPANIKSITSKGVELSERPESLQTPPGIFSSRAKYRSANSMQEPVDSKGFTKMLKKEWSSFPDALTTNEVIKLIGYTQSTLSDWIIQGRIIGIRYYNRYLIPKGSLIEYMATKAHRINQKSNKHMDLIRRYQEEKL